MVRCLFSASRSSRRSQDHGRPADNDNVISRFGSRVPPRTRPLLVTSTGMANEVKDRISHNGPSNFAAQTALNTQRPTSVGCIDIRIGGEMTNDCFSYIARQILIQSLNEAYQIMNCWSFAPLGKASLERL